MAIVLEAIYAKKLGLPGFSSHQFSVSIRTELTDLNQVEKESLRLYRLLQESVDQSIQETGFLPVSGSELSTLSNGNGNSKPKEDGAFSGYKNHQRSNGVAVWRCSDKQRDLIQKFVADNNIDKAEVESIAHAMFGAGVRQLDRLQASGLIDELFARFGASQARPVTKPGGTSNGHQNVNGFPPAPLLQNLPIHQHEGDWP